ncbi:hypothetical protein Acr_08g0013800 [Actinidia rufa]|uniref:Uncharacterized protein n=1 Tax=Actinidia rufa TaxID=165716 RepID=A0A7J0F2R6_9ERIC|nr:hypothetical protein Acr_08g0013800 [Actinidia rufa]
MVSRSTLFLLVTNGSSLSYSFDGGLTMQLLDAAGTHSRGSVSWSCWSLSMNARGMQSLSDFAQQEAVLPWLVVIADPSADAVWFCVSFSVAYGPEFILGLSVTIICDSVKTQIDLVFEGFFLPPLVLMRCFHEVLLASREVAST